MAWRWIKPNPLMGNWVFYLIHPGTLPITLLMKDTENEMPKMPI